MKKKIVRLILLLIIIVIGFIFRKGMPLSILGILYTVVGIMFSVGVGLIVSFNLQGIKNKSTINSLRIGLNKVRNKYISYFSASTVIFVLYECSNKPELEFNIKDVSLHFNLSLFTGAILLYSIFYFIINFLSIQRLSNQVFDEVNKSEG